MAELEASGGSAAAVDEESGYATQWRSTLWAMVAVQFVMTMAFSMLTPIMPLLLPELGVQTAGGIDIWAGILSGITLAWVTVASELSTTVILYSGPWRTLTIIMFQALEGTGAGVAVAAASVLIAISILPVLAAYRLLRRHELAVL